MVTLFRDLRRQLAFLTWTSGSDFPAKAAVICSPYLDGGSALLTGEANITNEGIYGVQTGEMTAA